MTELTQLRRQLQSHYLICCALVVSGASLVVGGTLPHHLVVGWVGICFFGTAALRMHHRLSMPAPRFEFDSFGLRVEHCHYGLIEWRDVEAASLWRASGAEWLSLRVTDAEKYFGRLAWDQRIAAAFDPNLGESALSVDVSEVAGGAEALLRRVEARLGRRR